MCPAEFSPQSLCRLQHGHGRAVLALGRGPGDGLDERDRPQHVPGRVQALGAQRGAAPQGVRARLGKGQIPSGAQEQQKLGFFTIILTCA